MVVTTMTNINTVANVAFALVREKTTACSTTLFQGVERFRERLGAAILHVVITDKDEQQRDALFEVWPDVQQQLCRFHILANVALQSKKKFVYKNNEGDRNNGRNGDGAEEQEQANEA
jgi:hypothetical protein